MERQSETISCTAKRWYDDTQQFNFCLLDDEGSNSAGECRSLYPCAAGNDLFTDKDKDTCPVYKPENKLSYVNLCTKQKSSLPEGCEKESVRTFQDENILAVNDDSLLVASCKDGKTYVTAPTRDDDGFTCKWTPIEGIEPPSEPDVTPNGFFGREACKPFDHHDRDHPTPAPAPAATPPNPSGTQWLTTHKYHLLMGGITGALAIAGCVVGKFIARNGAQVNVVPQFTAADIELARKRQERQKRHYLRKAAIHATFLNHLDSYGKQTAPNRLLAHLGMRLPVNLDSIFAALPDGSLKEEVNKLNSNRQELIDQIVSDCKQKRDCTVFSKKDEELEIRKALEFTPMLYMRSVFHDTNRNDTNLEALGILNETFKSWTKFPSYPIDIGHRHAGHLMIASVLCGLPGGCPPDVARRISESHRANEPWQEFWRQEKQNFLGIKGANVDGSDIPDNMFERALTQVQHADQLFPPKTRFQPNPLNPNAPNDDPWYIQSRNCLVRPINHDIIAIEARHMDPEKQSYIATGETFSGSGIQGMRAKLGDLALITMQSMGGESLPLTVNSKRWPDLQLSDEPGVYTSKLQSSPFDPHEATPQAVEFIEKITELRTRGFSEPHMRLPTKKMIPYR